MCKKFFEGCQKQIFILHSLSCRSIDTTSYFFLNCYLESYSRDFLRQTYYYSLLHHSRCYPITGSPFSGRHILTCSPSGNFYSASLYIHKKLTLFLSSPKGGIRIQPLYFLALLTCHYTFDIYINYILNSTPNFAILLFFANLTK